MEFRLNQQIENALKENTNILIAAGNHYTNGAKDWAISCGFHYMSTKKKDDLENKINEFCNNNFEKPVIFEIFTKIEDEQKAINLIQNFNKNKLEENLIKAFKVMIN